MRMLEDGASKQASSFLLPPPSNRKLYRTATGSTSFVERHVYWRVERTVVGKQFRKAYIGR